MTSCSRGPSTLKSPLGAILRSHRVFREPEDHGTDHAPGSGDHAERRGDKPQQRQDHPDHEVETKPNQSTLFDHRLVVLIAFSCAGYRFHTTKHSTMWVQDGLRNGYGLNAKPFDE